MTVLGQSQIIGAVALTVFAGAGLSGNLAGGFFADQVGFKRIMVISSFVLSGFYLVFLQVENSHLAMLLVAVLGFSVFASYSPAILAGQSYLPNRIGLSSGVTLGLAIAIGGGAAPFLGKLADAY